MFKTKKILEYMGTRKKRMEIKMKTAEQWLEIINRTDCSPSELIVIIKAIQVECFEEAVTIVSKTIYPASNLIQKLDEIVEQK